MRRFIILDTFDIQKINSNQSVHVPADNTIGGDGCEIIILSEEGYVKYLRSLMESDS